MRAGPLLAVPNVRANPSTASVPITVLLYDDPLLCGFYVAIKGLKSFTLLEFGPVPRNCVLMVIAHRGC